MATLVELKCEQCAAVYSVRPYRAKKSRFCSASCRARWIGLRPENKGPKPHLIGNKFRLGKPPAHRFPIGHKPWNLGMKGIHLSPQTEFKAGRDGGRQNVGSVSIRRDKMGRPRAWVKVADPNKWKPRAVVVWEAVNGPVPAGHVIHHENRNTLDDSLANLSLTTRADHAREHHAETREAWRRNREVA